MRGFLRRRLEGGRGSGRSAGRGDDAEAGPSRREENRASRAPATARGMQSGRRDYVCRRAMKVGGAKVAAGKKGNPLAIGRPERLLGPVSVAHPVWRARGEM